MTTSADTTITAERPLRADARRNREKIVNAARAIVAEHGEAAQIDDVARMAGVGVGTVYRHFPNKDALMGELVRMCVGECTALARSLADRADAWEAFADMVRGACETSAEDAASRRTWQAAGDDAFAYAAEQKAELHEAAGHLIERAPPVRRAARRLHRRRPGRSDVRPRCRDRRDARARALAAPR